MRAPAGTDLLVRVIVAVIVAAVILWLIPYWFAWAIALLAFLVILFGV